MNWRVKDLQYKIRADLNLDRPALKLPQVEYCTIMYQSHGLQLFNF